MFVAWSLWRVFFTPLWIVEAESLLVLCLQGCAGVP